MEVIPANVVPAEDWSMIRKLHDKILRQRGKDEANERYYRGLQDIGNLGISVPPEVEPFAFPLNWCRTYINVITERQDARMLMRSGEITEDPDLRRDWDSNDLDFEMGKAHRDMAVLGRCCLSVAADPDGGTPRIRVESPKAIAIEVDPVKRVTEAALRIYEDSVGRVRHMALYRPNYTLIMRQIKGKWTIIERVQHDLGRVPIVVQYAQQSSDDTMTGETIMEDLKQIVNMAARVMLALQLAMESVATPQKVALGVTQEDFHDEDGNPLDPWDTYLGAVWMLSGGDGKADIKQLPAADLKGFHETIRMLAEQASTVTGLPVRMMGQNTANPAAEGAIRADESRLVKQIERLNASAATAAGWALGIAERIRTREWPDGKIKIIYHNPGTPTESQKADALTKYTGGKPIMSRRGALVELGWSEERIERELKWLEEEDDFGALAEKLSRPAVPEVMEDPSDGD